MKIRNKLGQGDFSLCPNLLVCQNHWQDKCACHSSMSPSYSYQNLLFKYQIYRFRIR